MTQSTKRLSSTIIAVLFLVAAVIIYFEFIEPAYANVQQLKGQEASEQALVANEKNIVSQVQGIVSSYESESAQVQTVNLAMPVGQNNAEALAQIYGIAANGGLTIQTIAVSVQPATAATTAAASGANSNASGTTAIVKPAGSVSFQITGIGTYEALKTFLEGLESNIRVFDVTSLSIHAANFGTGATSVPDSFSYTMTVVAYYQSS